MIGCICIHGFTGGPYEVEPLAEHLKQHTDWYIEIPCLPGHGRELQLKTVDYKQWIQTCEASMKKVKEICDIIYIVGFSMGGMIASYLAAKYNVNKLVLLSTSRKYISVRQMGLDMSQFVVEGVKGTLKDNKLFQHYMAKRGSIPMRAMIEFLKCMRFTKPYLKKVNCPVLIAQGIQDGMVPYKTATYLDKEIPSQTEVIYFHDSKHLICLGEDREILIQAVDEFLNRP
ncbi:alpha/beta hydrolase [Aquibacillus kalidii]|uniref:alpha/beta hydrolase n=1 Tax=Aquibacillus kalidii TaxID=2762597 RepID=UPI001646BCA9|nr:alpha/beta fold hydrolase [Aquibacillus kalidii]